MDISNYDKLKADAEIFYHQIGKVFSLALLSTTYQEYEETLKEVEIKEKKEDQQV